MKDGPVQRLHAADGAAEHEAETADAERIEKARLRARKQDQYRALRDTPSQTLDGVAVGLHNALQFDLHNGGSPAPTGYSAAPQYGAPAPSYGQPAYGTGVPFGTQPGYGPPTQALPPTTAPGQPNRPNGDADPTSDCAPPLDRQSTLYRRRARTSR